MTREEAIEVYHELLNQKIKEAFEVFAPELRESEDERIRKRIRLCLDECVHSDIIRDYERDECLAYLEKQKEQKPAEWSEDIIRKGIKEVGLTQYQINWLKNNVFPPKEEQKPVDLEKATEEYIEKRASLAPDKQWDIEDMRDAVRFGAKWMKEQTQKQ